MRIVFSIAICALFAAAAGFGQQPVNLTLPQCVDMALSHNTNVIQAENSLEAAQFGTTAAYGALIPSLSLGGGFSRAQSWSKYVFLDNGAAIPNPNGSAFFADNKWNSGLSGSLTLFNGFSNTSNITRANSNSNAAQHSLERNQQTAIITTHQKFLTVVSTYELLKVSEDNLKRSTEQLQQIVEKNKVGSVALADVYRQQVQVGNDEFSLIQAQNNHEKAKSDLVTFLGVEYNQQYTFDFAGVPSDIDTTEFSGLNAGYTNYPNLVETALAKRPDYQASVEGVNSAEASVTMARANYFPVVSANASYGYNSIELDQLTGNRGLTVGLSVSLPLLNGFSTQNVLEQSIAQRQNAKEQMMQGARQLRVDVRNALLDLETAEKQVKVSQTTVKSAETDREIAQEKYNLGSGTLLDLLTATANYTNALTNKVVAVTNYLLAKKQVEYVLGVITH